MNLTMNTVPQRTESLRPESYVEGAADPRSPTGAGNGNGGVSVSTGGLPAIAPPIAALYSNHLGQLGGGQGQGAAGGSGSAAATPGASAAARSHSTSSSGSGERMTPGTAAAATLPASANLSPSSQPPTNASQPITPTVEQHHLVGAGFNFGQLTSDPGALAAAAAGGLPSTSGGGNPLFHPHLMVTNRLPSSTAHITAMGRRYPCKLCTAMFESKAELQIHTQVHMREAKPYKCTHCPKSFANSSYLSQHMRIHLGIKPFGPCQYCGRKFTQLSHLQQHLRTHTGEKPYKCRYGGCEKAFSQLSNLQSHSRCHQADKPFKCNSCYKCFSQEQELLDHIPKHKESKHLKIHICPYCGKSYTQATYLAKHMTKHSDRRDRDIRLREMMRGDEAAAGVGWGGAGTAGLGGRDGQSICAVHGIPDSCGDASPSLHYSFPAPSFAVPATSQNCAYPTTLPVSSAAAAVADSSAFSRFNALSALTASSMARAAPANLSAAQNRSAYFYDSLAKGNAAHQATSATFAPSTPYTSLIRLDDIRQYAGGGQAASTSAQEQFNMLQKRDSY